MSFDFEKVRALPGSYANMQGLRVVPAGVPFVFSAAGRAGWLHWMPGSVDLKIGLWFLMLFAALLCGLLVGKYYERRVGWVDARKDGLPVLAVALPIFVVLLWIHRQILDRSVPVPLHVVFVGLVLMWVGLARPGMRSHYVPIGAAWLGVASLAIVGVPSDVQQTAGDFTIAITLIAGGIADHMALRRLLSPVVE
jgi:hypothetical protein